MPWKMYLGRHCEIVMDEIDKCCRVLKVSWDNTARKEASINATNARGW